MHPHVVRASVLRVVTLHFQHSSSSFQTSINSGAHRTEIRKLSNNASQSTGTNLQADPERGVRTASHIAQWLGKGFRGYRDSSLFDAGETTRMVHGPLSDE